MNCLEGKVSKQFSDLGIITS